MLLILMVWIGIKTRMDQFSIILVCIRKMI